jgi:sec-independent protein translocase protein TatA
MLGLDNPLHIAFILVLLLLVFGAKRLPELGRSLGTGLRGFKESISGEETTSAVSPLHSADRVDELGAATPIAAVQTGEPVVERRPVHPVS